MKLGEILNINNIKQGKLSILPLFFLNLKCYDYLTLLIKNPKNIRIINRISFINFKKNFIINFINIYHYQKINISFNSHYRLNLAKIFKVKLIHLLLQIGLAGFHCEKTFYIQFVISIFISIFIHNLSIVTLTKCI